jgi:hypothetical protein
MGVYLLMLRILIQVDSLGKSIQIIKIEFNPTTEGG